MNVASSNDHRAAVRRMSRVGGAAAITVVGGTVFVGGQPVSAATFTVTTLNAGGTGSLFEAVADANATAGPDTIVFAPGLAGELDIGATTLGVTDDLTITGPGSAVITLTNQDNVDFLYLYNGASLTISGLTIDDAAGNAIRSTSVGALTLTDMQVIDSRRSGLRLYDNATVDITDSTISRSAYSGIYARYVGDVTLTDVSISSNGNDGIRLYDINDLTATRVSGASNDGDAIFVEEASGSVTVSDSDFGFSTDNAIGLERVDGSVEISGSTAQGVHHFADVDYVGGSVTIEDVTITTTFDDAIDVSNVVGAVTIRDVETTDTYDDAINIYDVGDPGTPADVTIERVTIDTALENAIDVNEIHGNVIVDDINVTQIFDNNIVDVTDVYDAGGGEGNVTISNVTASNADDGIDVEAEGSITVSDVTISSVRDDVIDLDSDGNITVERVTASDVYSGGIDIDSEGTITLSDTTLTMADEGVELDGYLGVTVSDVTIVNTLDDAALDVNAYDGSVDIERLSISVAENAGLYVDEVGGDVSISDISISQVGNSGIYLYNVSGGTTIENASISETGDRGIEAYNTGDVNIRSTTISDVDDDGIDLDNAGDVELTDIEISDPGDTGVALGYSGATTISGVTVSGANDSGMAFDSGGPVSIINSTIADNATTQYPAGAGIDVYSTDVTITGTTITDNSGPLSGAAVFAKAGSNVDVRASIVVDNDGLDAFGDDGSGATVNPINVLVDTGTGLGGTTIETDDALLGPLQDNGGPTRTIKPGPGSPAIDAVAIAAPPGAVDQRGVARPVGPAADLGSVEVDGGSIEFDPTTVTVDEDAGTVELTLVRTGGLDGDATVEVATASGSATSGDDFTAVADTVTIADNESTATVSIPIVDDGDTEANETFTATISSPTVVSIGSADTATVTLTDDDVVNDAISPLAPARFADTRPTGETIDDVSEKTGKLGAGDEIIVQIAGRGDVPADAVGVVMNVTAIQGEGTGFITAHPCLNPRPNTSSLNYQAGVPIGNEVVASLDGSGQVCLYSSQAAHLTVDVVGYIPAGSSLSPVTPARLVDTRAAGTTVDGVDEGTGTSTANGSQTFRIAGRGGVPADAAAAVLNITAVGATSNGFATVHPCVSPVPTASSLNFTAGVNRGNELVASLDANGDICVLTSASIHITIDVVAYVPAGSSLNSVTPARLYDSRPTQSTVDGLAPRTTKLAANEEVTIPIAGRAGVPASASAAIVNVTAVAPDGTGFFTVHPCADPRPLASSLNFVAGVNGGNEIVASLDGNGDLCVFASQSAHVTVDVVGYLD